MQSGIYKLINRATLLFYIGSTINFKKRWKQHVLDLYFNRHDNSYLQSHYNKYGIENFEFEILEYVDKSQLTEREQYWLDLLQPYIRNIGYNLAPIASSVRGIKWSLESREKFSKIKTGYKHTEATKLKMSVIRKANGSLHAAKLRGRVQSTEEKIKRALSMRKFDLYPHLLGIRCKCTECKKIKNKLQREYKERLKIEVDNPS